MCNHSNDLNTLKWADLYNTLQNYLYQANFHFKAHDKLANYKQIGQASGCINKIKHITQKIPNIIDNKLLD